MINKMLSLRNKGSFVLNPSGQLHVVDFGCGALAMQFAVVLAAADAIDKGQTIKKITVRSSDTSQAMINLGVKIWQQFKTEPSVTSSMDKAISLIEPRYSTSLPDFFREQIRGADYWVSAIHALYEDNRGAIGHALGRAQTVRPTAMLLSTHAFKGSLLSQVTPNKFKIAPYGIDPIEAPISGIAPRISSWRKALNEKIGLRHQFLDRNVEWAWPSEAWLIYNRPT